MGLLDRVKQNQTVPPAGPTGNGPATATLPGATPYAPHHAIPVAQPAAPAAPASPTSLSAAVAAAPRAVGGELSPAFTAAKVQIHSRLIEKFADEIDSSNKAGVREKIVELAEEYFRTTSMTMTKADKERLVDSVLDDVLGLGPLEALLADPSITEIMANHPKQIYVEKSGEPILSSVTYPLRSTGITLFHRYCGVVRSWLAHPYFRPHVFSACAFSVTIAHQVLKFRTKARMRFTLPIHRTPHGQ